jgi:hypothetical protein
MLNILPGPSEFSSASYSTKHTSVVTIGSTYLTMNTVSNATPVEYRTGNDMGPNKEIMAQET